MLTRRTHCVFNLRSLVPKAFLMGCLWEAGRGSFRVLHRDARLRSSGQRRRAAREKASPSEWPKAKAMAGEKASPAVTASREIQHRPRIAHGTRRPDTPAALTLTPRTSRPAKPEGRAARNGREECRPHPPPLRPTALCWKRARPFS